MAEEIEKAENPETLNGSESGNSQHEGDSSSEMLKPWLKILGKEYYQNEYLGKFDTLKDAVNNLLERPERKDVPESYGLTEGTDDLFKNAGLTKAEAESIDGFYDKKYGEKYGFADLKKVFGDSYDKTMEDYTSGKELLKDLEGDIAKYELDKNPVFVKAVAMIGRETKGTPFAPPKNDSKPEPYAKLYANYLSGKKI